MHAPSIPLTLAGAPRHATGSHLRIWHHGKPNPNPNPNPNQGSHSLIWHHGKHRALPLHAELCAPKEWRQASAMLNANALYVLSHFP